MKLLILGAGYSGRQIGRTAAPLFSDIVATTRSISKFAELAAIGMRPVIYDGATISPELVRELRDVTHLVQSIAPGPHGDHVSHRSDSLKSIMPALRWVGYLSTVGVYGDHQGAWVDEESPLRPVSIRSIERVQAENQWLGVAGRDNIALAILRLSGIYGPGRNTFINLTEGKARRLVKKDQVFNRIRVEDIGRATTFLIERSLGGIFNITDHQPAPPQDVVEEAARIMGVAVPPEQDFDLADLSPMARSFYGENKRVSNGKIRSLGFEFRFETYQQSLAQLWVSNTWRG